jgi:Zn-dependent alcohol dehydrogenase
VKVQASVLRAVNAALTTEVLTLDEPESGEILVRIRAAGLCHSDLSVLTGVRSRPLPMALGHEAAGEIVGLGPGVEGFEVGDHVVMSFVPSCGDCDECRVGRPALCGPGGAANAHGTLLGGGRRLRDAAGDRVNHHLGVSAFGDHVVVSTRSVVRVDHELPWDIAALFGCAVLTGVGAVVNAARVSPGESVAVFGLGGVGLSALLGAVAAGAYPILAIDRVASKLALAQGLGATHALHAAVDTAQEIRELTNGGVDHALETVGSAAVLATSFEATRRGGATTTVGLPHPHAELKIPAATITAEERVLRGSYLGSCVPSRDIPRFIALYRAGRLPVDRLLTRRLELSDLNDGFSALEAGEAVRQVLMFA